MRPDGFPSGSSSEHGARLFFALWPPPGIASVLHAQAERIAEQHGGRVMRVDTLHLTLAFLGEVADHQLPRLHAAAATVAGESFVLDIDHFTYWPHKRIFWARSATIPRQATELAGQLNSTLKNIEFRPITNPSHAFVPHLTLLRNVRDPIGAPPPLPALRWHCERFVLVRSHRSARGADYKHIGEWRLR